MKTNLKSLLVALLSLNVSGFAAGETKPAMKSGDEIVIPHLEFHQAKISEAVEFLMVKGRAAGAAPVNIVVLNAPKPEPTMSLLLTNIPLTDAIRYVAEFSGMKVRRDASAFVLEPGMVPPKAGASADSSGMLQKAEAIIIPRAEFRDASLAEAILFLHKRAAELDPNPNPALRGVNLIAMPLAPGSAEAKITLNLEKTSLSDILRYVASQTHLQLDVESSAMVFRPKNRDHSAKGSIQN